MKKGIFCISLDTELLWGRKDVNWQEFIPRAKRTRYVVNKMLTLFNKYDIPATWAVVGSLFEKPNENKQSNLWHAPDLLKQIQNVRQQEIASHSYSHEIFTRISRNKAQREIDQVLKLHKPKSFIFPRNQVNHLDILRKAGFTSFRGADRFSSGYKPSKYKQIFELLFLTPKVYVPKKESGLLNINGSMYFMSSRGIRKWLPNGLRVRFAKKGINAAIHEKKVFHMWSHPIDFTDNSEKLLNELEQIINYADGKRKEGELEILTMNQLVKRII